MLLFAPEDFALQFENAPFLIFEQHPFFRSLGEVVGSGMTGVDGHIDQVKVSVDINRRRPVSPEFAKLEGNSKQVFLTHLLASHAGHRNGVSTLFVERQQRVLPHFLCSIGYSQAPTLVNL